MFVYSASLFTAEVLPVRRLCNGRCTALLAFSTLLAVFQNVKINFGGSFFSLRFVAKRYILQQCLKRLIGSCVLKTPRYNFYNSLHLPWAPQCTALQTDRRTDRRHYDSKSRSYCVTARSPENCLGWSWGIETWSVLKLAPLCIIQWQLHTYGYSDRLCCSAEGQWMRRGSRRGD